MSTDYSTTMYRICQTINNHHKNLPHIDPTEAINNLHEDPSFKNTIRQALINTSPEIKHAYQVHDNYAPVQNTPLAVLSPAHGEDTRNSIELVETLEAIIREAFLDEAWAHGLDIWD